MARGALRGALSAAFGLTVLQVAVSQGGSSKIGGALDVVNGLVQKAFDPSVPAIPDRSLNAGAARSAAAGNTPTAQVLSPNPAGQAAKDPAPKTRTDYPTNGFPFLP